jgi:hypothetical protein
LAKGVDAPKALRGEVVVVVEGVKEEKEMLVGRCRFGCHLAGLRQWWGWEKKVVGAQMDGRRGWGRGRRKRQPAHSEVGCGRWEVRGGAGLGGGWKRVFRVGGVLACACV